MLGMQDFLNKMQLRETINNAVKNKDMSALIQLLQNDDYISYVRTSPEILSKAVVYDNLEAFKLFLAISNNLAAKAVALSVAVKHDRIDFAQHLLQIDDVKQYALPRYLEGKGALTNAIYNGRIHIAALLLKEEGAREALINESEERLVWAITSVLTWINQESSTIFGATPLESEINVINMLVSIFHERELDLRSYLDETQLSALAKFRTGISLSALAARQIPLNDWNNLPPEILPPVIKHQALNREMPQRAKRERAEDNSLDVQTAKRQETVSHVGPSISTTSSSSSSTAASSASSSCQAQTETEDLEKLMSETLLNQMRGLSVKERCKFILEQKLLSNPIYDNETWHQIAKLLNIKDEWHSELNDDQKLKVDSFFTMMEFAVENYPSTLIDALEINELVQMPVANNELCQFIVEKSLLAAEGDCFRNWDRIAQLVDMKGDWSDLTDIQKEELKQLCTKIDFIAKHFPAPLIDALGLSEMVQMRRLNLGDNTGATGYLDFITAEQLDDDAVAYGIDAIHRPFLTFKYDITARRNVRSHPQAGGFGEAGGRPGVSVDTLFQRYAGSSSTWVSASPNYNGQLIENALRRECYLHSNLLNFLNRLSHGEDVGICDYDYDAQAYAETDRAVARLSGRRP